MTDNIDAGVKRLQEKAAAEEAEAAKLSSDEAFKERVEAEKEALQQEASTVELVEVKNILANIDWKKPQHITKHAKVLIVSYDPVTRAVAVNPAANVIGTGDTISVLRDVIYQLEQHELTKKVAQTIVTMFKGRVR